MTYHADSSPITIVVEDEHGTNIKLRPASLPKALLPTVEPATPPGISIDSWDNRMIYVQLVALRTKGTLKAGRYRARLQSHSVFPDRTIDSSWVEFSKPKR